MVNFEMVEGARQVEQIVRRYMDCGWQAQALRKSYDECAHTRKNIPFAKSVGGTLVFNITTRFYAKQHLAPEPAMDPRGQLLLRLSAVRGWDSRAGRYDHVQNGGRFSLKHVTYDAPTPGA